MAEKKNMIPSKNVNGIELIRMVSTVKENRMGYIQQKCKCFKSAIRLYHIIGNTTTDNYKKILKKNIMKNCPGTLDDVNLADNISVPDIR